ncbi:MAG TPA: hypothetical protein VFV31_03170 [Chitinophagaceae bacterium]|nr:hypothetical protein [Chitinophagaceae bacterium]
MDKKLLAKGMIKGMEDMGATFVKSDNFDVYFDVKIGSEIDDETKLKRAKEVFMKSFGLGLKIRRVSANG